MMFSKIASIIADESTCCKKKVGAVIVKDERIVSHGYNGVTSKQTHCNDLPYREDHREWSKIHEIHAEQNAIAYAARAGRSTEGADIYITTSPCQDCAKLIAAAGIKRVIVTSSYSGSYELWREWLTERGIDVITHDL